MLWLPQSLVVLEPLKPQTATERIVGGVLEYDPTLAPHPLATSVRSRRRCGVDKRAKTLIAQLSSPDNRVRVGALQDLIGRTHSTVHRAYEAWGGLLQKLDDRSSCWESTAIRLLGNLARSDTDGRFIGSLDRLLPHTNDGSLITSRQRIPSFWKVSCVDIRAKGGGSGSSPVHVCGVRAREAPQPPSPANHPIREVLVLRAERRGGPAEGPPTVG